MNLEKELLRFHHLLVRDLAWALLSPPLIRDGTENLSWMSADWCRMQYEAYVPRLHQLDRHPEPLQTHVDNGPDRRLGVWFESLLSFWLADPANERYRLLQRGLKVDDGQRTIGELDFIVQDNQTGCTEHWEVAVKFYLGHSPGIHCNNWIGPSLRDRLDLKIRRLRDYQMPMHSRPITRSILEEKGWRIDKARALVKGRLFYPAHRKCESPPEAASSHLRGWWLPADRFEQQFQHENLSWLTMPMSAWLSPLSAGDLNAIEQFDTHRFIEHMTSSFHNRPLAVLGYDKFGIEQERGFVAPLHWENQFA